MFWYSEQMRRKLIELPLMLSKNEQEYIIRLLEAKTKIIFVFNRDSHYLLINNEFLFMRVLCDVSPREKNMERIINGIIGDDLRYDSDLDIVYNQTGSFGCTYIMMIEGKEYIKKIPLNSNENFNKEFNTMSDLYIKGGFDYIPCVANYNKEDGSYMEEVAIDSLDNFIKTSKEENFAEKVKILYEIIVAIGFVHSRSVVHRDLHPGNILLFRNNNNTRWKIVDFGLAYNLINNEPCGERHGGCYGDRKYISPEQLNNFDCVLFENDIYSIGKLINFVLTKNPDNFNHKLVNISKKCCSPIVEGRYSSSVVLLGDFTSLIKFQFDNNDLI